ncbi:MAG: 50S ribosomal protein L11 methyltransferase [Chlorobi bacterium]|nr:MAG: 50S ribosomal protein L11 methyltransferase [Chlorobi bacterium OLB7]MBK8911721.1 50S ribosomal protein L11 methyltransferase [Chlorobiota bacterium]MBX7216536.1 50S ribosomal protein L11 methyltransferase [Candidatus Kapabacteria bacterium]
MKHYDALTCYANRETLELLLAVSSTLPITGTLDEDTRITLYFDEAGATPQAIQQLQSWLPEGANVQMEITSVAEQNWNAEFEASLQPVRIGGGLLITQSWQPEEAEEGTLRVVIDPKMSFGTGHHESTRLISQLLMQLDPAGKRVLDIGTGTGVLAIVAALRGAARTLAFDNNEWAVANTLENVELNGVADRIDVRQCELDDVAEGEFDVVLANLHRNIIMQMLPGIVQRMAASGAQLLTSGVLIEDYQSLLDEAASHGLRPIDEARENEWVATVFGR